MTKFNRPRPSVLADHHPLILLLAAGSSPLASRIREYLLRAAVGVEALWTAGIGLPYLYTTFEIVGAFLMAACRCPCRHRLVAVVRQRAGAVPGGS